MTGSTTPAEASTPPKVPQGSFAPLHHTVFAAVWVTTVLGNMGTFMRDVASSWLVTDLSASPAAVALIQAAGTLPIFLLAIPAGVLSDILDRRRFLIGVQVGLALVSATLALLAWTDTVTVTGLVALTFLGGVGAALAMPTWQAITPELVPRPELKSAVALNSLGFNISRSIGPALGGLMLVTLGAAATYGLGVLSYVIVIAVLLWWKREASADHGLREQFGGALRAGLRYVRASGDMHRVLWRAVLFFALASAVWALLPIVARRELGGGPGFYGLMLGSVGAGAIAAALALSRVRARIGQDRLVLLASLLAAASTALLALTDRAALALVLTFVLGIAWIAILSTLNSTMQGILPNWVRGRGLAIYLTAFNGAMAAGSVGWGLIAQAIGIDNTLATAGLILAIGTGLAHRAPLPAGEADLTPSLHWPEPALAEPVDHDRGPVMVTVTYRIRQQDRGAFLAALNRLSEERRRDGAYVWACRRTPRIRSASWSGSSSSPGPSTCASTGAFPSWMQTSRPRSEGFTKGLATPPSRTFLPLTSEGLLRGIPWNRRADIMKIGLGLLLAFGIGVICSLLGLPLPAPLALTGAALVLAMSAGYEVVDRYSSHEAVQLRTARARTGKHSPIKQRRRGKS